MSPAVLRDELRSHNRHALIVAVLSALGAIVAWNLAYFAFNLVVLGFLSAIHGDFGPDKPGWMPPLALILGGILFFWGSIDAHHRRFAIASDRQVIGWHLIPDVLLLPARLTFAVWGNLSAIRRLSDDEIDRAWALLLAIHRAGQAKISSLGAVEADPALLPRLLATLQILNYIDLHRGKEEWFYSVCSPREPELRALAGGPEE